MLRKPENKIRDEKRKYLGKIGEDLGVQLLRDNGFIDISNTNEISNNDAYCDLKATKDGIVYIFSVKARNKYEFNKTKNTFRINSRYKLGSKCFEHAEIQEIKYKATAAWLTIALDKKTYSAYWGLLSEIAPNKGVNMSARATITYRKLAEEFPHSFEFHRFSNIY